MGDGGDVRGAGHNAPCSNRDFHFFYRGLEKQQLLVQRCGGCGTLRSLPSPACATCRSLEWDSVALAGGGRVHSFVVHHYPPLPGFVTPHPIVLATMDEGVRLIGAMDGTPPERVAIDQRIAIEFLRRGDLAAYRFRPA